MSLEIFEKAINEVTDKDWSWWPFLWLRPEKNERLSLMRLAAIAILFGVPSGGLMALSVAAVDPRAHAAAPAFVMGFPLLMFFIASVLVGPMWNRRADRIRNER